MVDSVLYFYLLTQKALNTKIHFRSVDLRTEHTDKFVG